MAATEVGIIGLASAAAIGGVLGLGALHLPVALGAGAAMLLAAIVALFLGTRVSFPATICMVAAGYTALQAAPLPIGAVRALSVETAEIWARATSLVSPDAAHAATLSLSPGSSWLEVLKWWVYAGALVAGRFIGQRRGPNLCVALIFGTGVCVALLTIAHGVVGASRVYGWYAPVFAAQGWPTGPLLNSNNLAGFMNLAAFTGLGLLFSRRESGVPKALVALGVAVVLGCMFVSASRGGVVAFVIAGLVFAGSLIWRKGSRRVLGSLLVGAGVVTGGILLGALAWSERMTADLVSRDVPKIELWKWSLALSRDFPWFGVGRGGFEGAIAPYRTIPGHITFAYAENFPLQFVSEWGVPFGVAVLVGLAIAFRPRRFARSTASTGAYAGFIALVAQNLVDLSFELMGVTLAVMLLLGCCREEGMRPERGNARKRLGAVAFALASAGVLCLAASLASNPVVERQRLHADFNRAVEDRSAGAAERARALLGAAVLSAPGSAYPYQLGSVAALRFGFDPLPWVARALERDPMNPRVHLTAARTLAARGAVSQAFLHLRLASKYEPALDRVVAQLAAGFTQSADQLELAAAPGKAGVTMLVLVADEVGSAELRERLLRRAMDRDRKNPEPLRLLALDLIQALESKTPRCANEAKVECQREVRELADALQARAPKNADWVRLRARLLILDERWSEADEVLAKHCAAVERRLDCVELRLSTSLRSTQPRNHQSVVEDLRDNCVGPEGCARVERMISEAYLGMGWQREALAPRRRVAELMPTVGNWMAVAELATALGNRIEADRAMSRALEIGPERAIAQRVQELRAKLAAAASGG